MSSGHSRKEGGARRAARSKHQALPQDLEALAEASALGHHESPLRWRAKSLHRSASELQTRGHEASRRLVAQLFNEAGYCLQANRKTRKGSSHPDRDAHFRCINEQGTRLIASSQPVISADTKKRELIGDFKNSSREWRPKGSPQIGACARHHRS